MADDNEIDNVGELLINACRRDVGVLSGSFLCQSISSLHPKTPICVASNVPVKDVLSKLRTNKIGCVCVVGEKGELVGIFSERDCLLKITENFNGSIDSPISEFMTREPITQEADGTIAFTLTLMSQGGFRHLPIVDSSGVPIAMVSVKDVVDAIVAKLLTDLDELTPVPD